MTDPVVIVSQTNEVTVYAGLQGPPGSSWVPNPESIGDGMMLITQGGEYVATEMPDGTGDMSSLIYDPDGLKKNLFNIANLNGDLDCGEF